mmetsp:Transcript_6376/g.11654  ORF Transcript_6376/g.11654 Transcript_6376/m.11654 type:complete len:267 (+) Transcript_6376:482-1282(+)
MGERAELFWSCRLKSSPSKTRVTPSNSIFNLGLCAEQSPANDAGALSRSYISGKTVVGTARRDVPESTTALQPSSQKGSRSSSTQMALICRSQWPSSGSSTALQLTSSCKCSSAQPPMVIWLVSSLWVARKMPKVLLKSLPRSPVSPDATSKKLKREVCDRLSSPSPSTPSKTKSLKGSADMSVAAMNLMLTQFSPPWPATGTLVLLLSAPGPRCPKHSSSSMNTPVTSPVPKDTVIWSRASPGLTVRPSQSMSRADVEEPRLYLR